MTLETMLFTQLYEQEVVRYVRDTYTHLLEKGGKSHIVSVVTWEYAKDLEILVPLLASLQKDETIWFEPSDPYPGNKPFDIDHIGLRGDGQYILYVCGQKTARICKKWERILSQYFGYPVELQWRKEGGVV